MAAIVTGIILIIFLALQLIQGVLLDVYLEIYVPPVTEELSQWLWIIADGLLLLLTLVYYAISRIGGSSSSGHSAIRNEFCGIPSLAMAWLMYLLVVLLPRTIWVMVASGRCLGKQEGNSTSEITRIGNQVGINFGSFDQNFWVTLVSAGTTLLLVLLTMAQQSEHGLLRRGVALDFDIAEATFGTIDGVEYWQPFFDAKDINCCNILRTTCQNVTNATVCDDITTDDRNLITALDGPVGYFLIIVACTSFILPFFAIWQLQKKSEMIRRSQDGDDEESTKDKVFAVLEFVYMLFDLFAINIPGFALRMYIWLVLKQTITALITKNVMGIIFRLLLIYVKYIQPRLRKRFHKNKQVHPKPSRSNAAAEGRTRARQNWTKPTKAAKVADSFMPDRSQSKIYPESVTSHETNVPDERKLSRNSQTSPARAKLVKQEVVLHANNFDTSGPVYLSPANDDVTDRALVPTRLDVDPPPGFDGTRLRPRSEYRGKEGSLNVETDSVFEDEHL